MSRRTVAVALAVSALAAMACAGPALARDQIRIVGSSTVYPFATAVAEQFGKTSGFKTPVVESTGSGGGVKLFCDGDGADTPDIVNASRRILPDEMAACIKAGVTHVAEIVIGYDGIVVANARQGRHYTLTRQQLWLALAKTVPLHGKLVANPYRTWSDIDPRLPADPIVIYGPASNHGTRDALADLVMERGCTAFPEIQALSGETRKVACEAIREDGAYVEVAENYTVTLQKLLRRPHALGILPFSYLDQNGDRIQGASIDGHDATYENIASGSYPLARPLYLYVKKDHLGIIPGIREYLAEFTGERAWGKDGYLVDKGLIAAPDNQRRDEAVKARTLPDLKL